MRINCTIAPQDDIFQFFTRHPLAANPVREYLSDGWRTLSELILLLDQAGASLTHMERVLEFAAGFGRFTRHLVKAIPGKVTCADVLPGTVEFLREQFHVDAFYSRHDPARITYPRQYDLVFVLSLFTHLPVHMWSQWLTNLARAVRPGGLLVLSVHNEALAPHLGITFGADGTHFVASSESPSLAGSVYGTTFTTRRYVETAIEQALGRAALLYQPFTFWGGQDGVVIRV
jgi:SAM-dependent methyltransferase